MARNDAQSRGPPHKRKDFNRTQSGRIQKPHQGSAKPAGPSTSALKRRLRDLNRLLQKSSDLPADIRIGHEREMQSLQHELTTVLLSRERNDMISKYHKVRFFERQKATRHLKKATKALEECDDKKERRKLAKKEHAAQVDLNYTQYYPHMTPYVSLWKRVQDGEEHHYEENNPTDGGAHGNIEMWKKVEQAMEDGTLEKLKESVDEEKAGKIREDIARIGEVPATGGKAANGKTSNGKTSNGKVKKHDAVDAEEDEEDQTGAGFFE